MKKTFSMKYIMTGALLAILLLPHTISAQVKNPEIKWLSFEQAVEKSIENPKKIFIDVYTDWCGWCKKMDAETFANPVIVDYMNDHFYAVKFDAERSGELEFEGKTYTNPNPGVRRSSHEFAQFLLQGQMSYPSYVFMDENKKPLTVVKGYIPAPDFEPIINFIGDNAYDQTSWEDYRSNFTGELAD